MRSTKSLRKFTFSLTAIGLAALVLAACAGPAPTATPRPQPTPQPTATPVVEVVPETTPDATPDVAETPEATPEATPDVAGTPDAAALTPEATVVTPEAAAVTPDTAATTPEAPAAVEGFPGTISVSTTRMREAPSLTGTVIQELQRGTMVLVLGETANGGYVYVRLEDGTEGWVAKQAVALEDVFARPPIMTP
jgi:outer membrane biosynthesis protein TonB